MPDQDSLQGRRITVSISVSRSLRVGAGAGAPLETKDITITETLTVPQEKDADAVRSALYNKLSTQAEEWLDAALPLPIENSGGGQDPAQGQPSGDSSAPPPPAQSTTGQETVPPPPARQQPPANPTAPPLDWLDPSQRWQNAPKAAERQPGIWWQEKVHAVTLEKGQDSDGEEYLVMTLWGHEKLSGPVGKVYSFMTEEHGWDYEVFPSRWAALWEQRDDLKYGVKKTLPAPIKATFVVTNKVYGSGPGKGNYIPDPAHIAVPENWMVPE